MSLSGGELAALKPGLSATQAASFGEMGNPASLDTLLELGTAAAALKIQAGDFPPAFDLAR